MIRRAVVVTTVVLLATACAGRTHIAEPAQGQTISWLLRAGPQEGSQPIVCASDMPAPCVITVDTNDEKPIEATVEIALPRSKGHTFKGQAALGFIGSQGDKGYTKQINLRTEKDPALSSTTGIVRRAGRFPMMIALDETGADLEKALHHNIEVTVTVQ
jgi:hypothetical protein